MDIKVEYLEEAQAYLDGMSEKARKKMLHNVALVRIGVMDTRIFKKLSDSGIWEFKAEYEGNEYRLLSFWDKQKSSLVVATHGFDKKTQKTPQAQLVKAQKYKKDYERRHNHE